MNWSKLVEALRADARLVLVGDPDQLASVEAGAVPTDIIGPAGDGRCMSEGHPQGIGHDGQAAGGWAVVLGTVRRSLPAPESPGLRPHPCRNGDQVLDVLGSAASDMT